MTDSRSATPPAQIAALALTAESEKLLNDFDKHPEAIDYSELSARLWMIERAASGVTGVPAVSQDAALPEGALRPGLDVSQLCTAMRRAGLLGTWTGSLDCAAKIAAEYAHLVADQPDPLAALERISGALTQYEANRPAKALRDILSDLDNVILYVESGQEPADTVQ